MFKANEQFGQFAAVNQAAIESLLTVANTSLATAERLAALNLNTARSFVADGASAVAALLAVKDVQSIELKKTFSNAVEQSLKSAPAGSETVVAAVKSALAQADSAYETMSRQAKQAKATIEANVAAANAATLKLMSQAA